MALALCHGNIYIMENCCSYKCGNELGSLVLGVLKEPYGVSLEKHMGGSLMFCQVIGGKWLPCSFWA